MQSLQPTRPLWDFPQLRRLHFFRGYPETLSSCHSDITQHSCGSETQGDRKEKAY